MLLRTGHAGGVAIPGLPGNWQHRHAAPAAAPYQRHRLAAIPAPVPGNDTQAAFIKKVAPGAMAAQHKYGVPASVTIAQAIDESGWGRSVLATKDNNLFGIKGAGTAGSDPQPTQELVNGQLVDAVASFGAYHNISQSIDAHGKLLATSGYYQHAMAQRHDADAFAAALTGVYATDPAYGAKLIGLMRQYHLYRYDTAPPGHRYRASATPALAAPPGGAAIPGPSARRVAAAPVQARGMARSRHPNYFVQPDNERFADLTMKAAEFAHETSYTREPLEQKQSESSVPPESEPAQATGEWVWDWDTLFASVNRLTQDCCWPIIALMAGTLSLAESCKPWALSALRLLFILAALLLAILYATSRLETTTVGTWAAIGAFLVTAFMLPTPARDK